MAKKTGAKAAEAVSLPSAAEAAPSQAEGSGAVPSPEPSAEELAARKRSDGSWASSDETAVNADTWATTIRECPHCSHPMVKHESTEGPKVGAWHCDACGGCWVHRGSRWYIRDGHPHPRGWEDPAEAPS